MTVRSVYILNTVWYIICSFDMDTCTFLSLPTSIRFECYIITRMHFILFPKHAVIFILPVSIFRLLRDATCENNASLSLESYFQGLILPKILVCLILVWSCAVVPRTDQSCCTTSISERMVDLTLSCIL